MTFTRLSPLWLYTMNPLWISTSEASDHGQRAKAFGKMVNLKLPWKPGIAGQNFFQVYTAQDVKNGILTGWNIEFIKVSLNNSV